MLYNVHGIGFLTGKIYKGPVKGVCAPGLNCYSCPGAVAACPLGSLQQALAKGRYRAPLYMLGTILLFGILFGRVICGFLCPFGLLQELLHKIPGPKIPKSRFTRVLSWLKYIILLIFVILIPVVRLVPGFCKYICPAGTLEAGIPLAILDDSVRSALGALFSWKMFVLVLVLLLCVFCYRGFCRFLCPLGAIWSLFSGLSFFGICVDKEKCCNCMQCVRSCKMDVKKPGDHECIHCGACREVCPTGAIGSRLKKKGN